MESHDCSVSDWLCRGLLSKQKQNTGIHMKTGNKALVERNGENKHEHLTIPLEMIATLNATQDKKWSTDHNTSMLLIILQVYEGNMMKDTLDRKMQDFFLPLNLLLWLNDGQRKGSN